ncbi:hypothetical protein GQ43DRAFT_388978 [Delitschia confertaspora ATCC 74209]|uniref:Uncharacterized protein n=1 Tax=Delitschia confertaspora ATCC 74209 TaxID=1513339 RepID=A0A9P4JQY5_9PLEO|nr:hypothetical protein GQ43DRAFT_388978 [Delitschia confertaspora ATCC 74209]
MNSLPRSCSTALARAAKSPQILNASSRAFSQSAACKRGTLPSFQEPSSPELSAVLQTLNSRVLLPSHLTHDQRLLIYRQKNRSRIEAEPIHITLGDVELPLEHLNRNTDQPSRWSAIKQVVDLAQTPADWENVVRMLEGFHDAGIRMKPEWEECVVRKMFENGQGHLAVRALERVRETGLSLKREGVRNLVFQGIRSRASESGWKKKETEASLAVMERVIELMENKLHLGKSSASPRDPRASPFVIAYPLELAAMRARKHLDGKDEAAVVHKYAVRLMAAFKQDGFMESTLPTTLTSKLTLPSDFKTPYHEKTAVADLRRNVISFIPVWNALQTSSSVLQKRMPMPDDAKKITDSIWKAMQGAVKELQKREKLGDVKEKIEKCKV